MRINREGLQSIRSKRHLNDFNSLFTKARKDTFRAFHHEPDNLAFKAVNPVTTY